MWREQLEALYAQLMGDAIAWAPRIVALVVLVVVAFIVAVASERILRAMLKRVRFDTLLARAGIDHALHRFGIRQPMNELVPRLAFYLLLILFARTAADVLGLAAISDAIAAAMGYVPNVLAAVAILMIGGALAQFAGGAVRAAAEGSGLHFARSLGSAVSGLILFVLAMMAMAQLQIDTEMVRLVSAAALGSIGLAFGISFGLGSSEIARAVLAGFYARQLYRVGDHVTVGGTEGTLIGITPTQLLVETAEGVTTVPNLIAMRDGGRYVPAKAD